MVDNIILGAATVAFIVWALSHFLEGERIDLEKERLEREGEE
jgi:hypothetical protein